MPDPSTDFTHLLERAPADERAPDELPPLVYDQLEAIARRCMEQERASHTLQATALVHDVLHASDDHG